MKQGLELARGLEIPAVQPEIYVRAKAQCGQQAVAEIGVFERPVQPARQAVADQQHQQQRRQDTPRPAFIKAPDAVALLLDLGKENAADQKAADDKKDIDAEEASGQPALEAGMEQDDRADGNGAQAVDIFAVLHGRVSVTRP